MTLQWTLIALFLYVEVAILILLMLPWIKPPFWKKVFHSRLVKTIEAYSNVFYYAFGGILLLLFLDAIREVRKYGQADITIAEQYSMPHADAMIHMRLFRAQRNFYIAGMALFLYMVCRHMVKMIVLQANLMTSNEESLKRGRMSARHAQSFMDSKKDGQLSSADNTSDELKDEMVSLRKELSKAIKDRDAMKEQVDRMKVEYDRLLKDFDGYQASERQKSD